MIKPLQVGSMLLALSVLGWLGGCSDATDPCSNCGPPPPTGVVVSDPLPQTSGSSQVATMSVTDGSDLVYISLFPGTVPGATRLVIRNPSAGFVLTAATIDGGIDPVPVPAAIGDTIIVVVTDSSGHTLQHVVTVKPNRPPVVVRTEPPQKKTDVPLNAAIVIVFSEPMDSGSITPQSIELRANGQPVSARVTLAADRLRVLVVPEARLVPNTSYRLVATTGATDVSGLSLSGQVQVDFTTGSTTSRGSSLTISPATATMPVGSVLQLTGTMRDGNGNAVQIGPLLWSVSPNGTAAVSASGLARALEPGRDTISAVPIDTISGFARGTAFIDVVAAPELLIDGAWDWTEIIRDPANGVTCNDTGTYVFTQTGNTFAGTSRQVGACTTPRGAIDNTHVDPVTDGRAGGNSLSFAVLNCSYGATAIGTPVQLSGPLSCGPTATGTWAAYRPRPLASVAVLPSPLPAIVHGDTLRVSAALRDPAGNRVFFRPVSWASDNPAVATISGVGDSAVVIATGPGTATITAAAEGQAGAAVVTVTAAGTFRVTTATSGVDPDTNGYAVSVDGGAGTAIPPAGVVTLTPFRAGTHSVGLAGIADNCTVAEPNPTLVNVTLAETTAVAFTITCTAAGSLRVTTVSSGVGVPSGYLVSVDGGPAQVIGANDQLVIAPLGARSHAVFLDAPNHCAVAGANPTTVVVTAGNTFDVAFQVACVAIGQIAFSGAQGFVTISADGSAIVPFPVAGVQPAWSPDGTRIAFMPLATDCAGAPAQSVVCIMNADGSGIHGLPISTTIGQGGLAWSPDGSKIAFLGSGGLYAANVDGSGDVQLTSGVLVGGFPVWSPDGSKIAFTCVVASGNFDVCAVNADGTGLVRLTTDPGDDHRPSWKPDGSKIVFATFRFGSDTNGNPTIAEMNPDGSGVTPIGNGDAPAWSPDGGRIAFIYSTMFCDTYGVCYNSDLWLTVMRVDGSGRKFVGVAAYAADTPAWKP